MFEHISTLETDHSTMQRSKGISTYIIPSALQQCSTCPAVANLVRRIILKKVSAFDALCESSYWKEFNLGTHFNGTFFDLRTFRSFFLLSLDISDDDERSRGRTIQDDIKNIWGQCSPCSNSFSALPHTALPPLFLEMRKKDFLKALLKPSQHLHFA